MCTVSPASSSSTADYLSQCDETVQFIKQHGNGDETSRIPAGRWRVAQPPKRISSAKMAQLEKGKRHIEFARVTGGSQRLGLNADALTGALNTHANSHNAFVGRKKAANIARVGAVKHRYKNTLARSGYDMYPETHRYESNRRAPEIMQLPAFYMQLNRLQNPLYGAAVTHPWGEPVPPFSAFTGSHAQVPRGIEANNGRAVTVPSLGPCSRPYDARSHAAMAAGGGAPPNSFFADMFNN